VFFILSAADTNKDAMERTLEWFRGFRSCYSSLVEQGIIHGTGAWDIGDIRENNAMNQAYETGKRLV
jgi:hypothetical protein